MFYIKYFDKTIKTINKSNILYELYYNLGTIASEKYTNKEIEQIKKEISLIFNLLSLTSQTANRATYKIRHIGRESKRELGSAMEKGMESISSKSDS